MQIIHTYLHENLQYINYIALRYIAVQSNRHTIHYIALHYIILHTLDAFLATNVVMMSTLVKRLLRKSVQISEGPLQSSRSTSAMPLRHAAWRGLNGTCVRVEKHACVNEARRCS